MEYSVSRVDITPVMDVFMDGYGARNGLSKGVHDSIYANSLLLKDNGSSFLILSMDILSIKREKADEIKQKIAAKYGLSGQNILIHATHVHSGPALAAKLSRGCIEEYVKFFDEQVMKSVDMCFKDTKTGTLYYGEGETYIGMSRRQRAGGEVRLAPAPDVPVDRKLSVVVIKDKNEKIAAVIFNCACHPATMGGDNYLISAEFPGVARKVIEESFPGSTSLFIQGACGDINPAVISKGSEYRQAYFSDVEFSGKILANDVSQVIKYGLKKVEPSFGFHIRSLTLPIGEYRMEYFREMAESGQEYRRKYGKYMLEKIEKGEETKEVKYDLGIIRLASNLKMITFEGEVCSEYGVWIREFEPLVNIMIAGYSNGHKSYLPTKRILHEGGYEATVTYCWAGYPGPYAENVQDIVLNAVKEEFSGGYRQTGGIK